MVKFATLSYATAIEWKRTNLLMQKYVNLKCFAKRGKEIKHGELIFA